jgi:hypothetical protein
MTFENSTSDWKRVQIKKINFTNLRFANEASLENFCGFLREQSQIEQIEKIENIEAKTQDQQNLLYRTLVHLFNLQSLKIVDGCQIPSNVATRIFNPNVKIVKNTFFQCFRNVYELELCDGVTPEIVPALSRMSQLRKLVIQINMENLILLKIPNLKELRIQDSNLDGVNAGPWKEFAENNDKLESLEISVHTYLPVFKYLIKYLRNLKELKFSTVEDNFWKLDRFVNWIAEAGIKLESLKLDLPLPGFGYRMKSDEEFAQTIVELFQYALPNMSITDTVFNLQGMLID